MEKIIDFKTAKKRLIAKRKQERKKNLTFNSVALSIFIMILTFSFLSTYQLVSNGNLSFLNMKIGMGTF